jgi:RimJ/RimL family protein N-acetyltransferase
VTSISTLVDPDLWGQGISAATKTAVSMHLAAAAVESFHASIRADNARSMRAIVKVPGIQFVGTEAEGEYPWRHYRWPR